MSRAPLLVRIGALGDMVLLTVAIAVLHERFGCKVDILGSGPWTRPLLAGQPGVGQIYLLNSRSRPFWLAPDQWQLVRELRARQAGPSWLFDAKTDKERRLLQRAGWRDQDLVQLQRLADIPNEHFCDRWRRFALLDPSRSPGAATTPEHPDARPRLQVSPQALAECAPWRRRHGIGTAGFILIQVGNKRTMRLGPAQRPSNTKYWPEERWAQVLRGLRDLHPQHALLLLGVGREAALNDRILGRAAIGNAHNLAREMNVPRLMALCAGALGMISVDTGPAHVAAAIGCPVVALFDSASKLHMYAPRGPRGNAYCLTGKVGASSSLLGILPSQVLDLWVSLTHAGQS